MRCIGLLVIISLLSALLSGCQDKAALPPESEPTTEYEWMAGDSLVSQRRLGIVRGGLNYTPVALSPSGIYILPQEIIDHGTYKTVSDNSYVMYADHGSSTFTKLCGRTDCTHDNADCNAYLYKGSDISYYQGKLYAVSGESLESEQCMLLQMSVDGSQHKEVLDISAFARKQNADFAECVMITDGYCIISLHAWTEGEEGNLYAQMTGFYRFKLDGSMDEPAPMQDVGWILYQCGDILAITTGQWVDGVLHDQCWDYDLETGTRSFLMDHPNFPLWFEEEDAFYFRNGSIMRWNYATKTEEVLVNTGLEGDYYAFCFPDCLVLASREEGGDNTLYFYNWAYELVEAVQLDYPHICSSNLAVMGETAERVILSDSITSGARPLYYIKKSELGSGNAKLYTYQYVNKGE